MSSNDLNWRNHNNFKFKRRKYSKKNYKEGIRKKFTQEEIDNSYPFRSEKEIIVSKVSDSERSFFREWTASRYIEEQFAVLALTYWTRVKSQLGTFFMIRKKELYMLACIHLSLKWLGYDEIYKCNFIQDFKQISNISKDEHMDIEFHVFKELNYTL